MEKSELPAVSQLELAHRMAFDGFYLPLSLFDSDGFLIDINQAALDLFGIVSKEPFLKKNVSFFGDPNMDILISKDMLDAQDMRVNLKFNCDTASQSFPGYLWKRGMLQLSMCFHTIYDDEGNVQFYMAETTDLTNVEERKEMMTIYTKNISILLRSAGVSLWIYDIFANRRMLINGPHLFSDMSDMDDFMSNIHSSDLPEFQKRLDDIKSGLKYEDRVMIRIKRHKDDPQYIFLDLFMMAHLGAAKISYVTCLSIDITEKTTYFRELKVKENRLHSKEQMHEKTNLLFSTVIDRMPCVFFIKDADDDFRYLMANDMFCEKVGVPKNEVIGKSDYEILKTDDDIDIFRRNDIRAVAEGSCSITEKTSIQGKNVIWQSSKYCLKTNTGQTLVLGLCQDVTPLFTAYSELEKAKVKAEESDRLKSAFLANMSHEIRTPLNSIIGFSAVMADSDDASERGQYGEIVASNGKTLVSIIDNILDISKIEAGYVKLSMEQFSLQVLFSSVKFIFGNMMKEGVSLVCDFPDKEYFILSDRNRIQQVVNNFMSNAVKYTPAGTITLGYDCGGGKFSFYVKDTGIGIRTIDLPKVFSRFEKLDSYAPGTGLGLSICKLLAEKLNGSVSCKSEYGKGTVFTFEIPCEISLK